MSLPRIIVFLCLLVPLLGCNGRTKRHHQFLRQVAQVLTDTTKSFPEDWRVDEPAYIEVMKNDTHKVRVNDRIVYQSLSSKFEFYQGASKIAFHLAQLELARLGCRLRDLKTDSIVSDSVRFLPTPDEYVYHMYSDHPIGLIDVEFVVLESGSSVLLWGVRLGPKTDKKIFDRINQLF